MAVQPASIMKLVQAIRDIQEELEPLKEEREEVLVGEGEKDNPANERLDKYNNQVEILTEAYSLLEEAAEELRGYK